MREKTLIEQFPKNTQCVYYGSINNTSDKNEKLIKFGNSNDLKARVSKHKETYLDFHLINAFKVENKIQIENAIKDNPLFVERKKTITIKNKNYVELLNSNDLCLTVLDKTIKDIITSIEYSPENYKKILEENYQLKKKIDEKNNKTTEYNFLKEENKKLKIENIYFIKKMNDLQNKKNIVIHDPLQNSVTTQNEIDNYGFFIQSSKKFTKNKNGTYNIDGHMYKILFGSRTEVWNETSYKTTGGLLKSDLMINKNGKVVSKKKCLQETLYNRFQKAGINQQTIDEPITLPFNI